MSSKPSVHAFADLFSVPRTVFREEPLSALVSFAWYIIGDTADSFYEAAAPEVAARLAEDPTTLSFMSDWEATGFDESILADNGDLFFGYANVYRRMRERPTAQQATAVLRALPTLRAGGHDVRTFKPLAYDRKLVALCVDIAEVLDDTSDIAFEYLETLIPLVSAKAGPRW